MVLRGEEAQVQAQFSPFSANLLPKIGPQFPPNILQAHKSFSTHLMVLLCDVGHVEPHFGPFGDSVSVSTR
jgi:hypothetical protein